MSFNEGRGPLNFFLRWRKPGRGLYLAVRAFGRWFRLILGLRPARRPNEAEYRAFYEAELCRLGARHPAMPDLRAWVKSKGVRL